MEVERRQGVLSLNLMLPFNLNIFPQVHGTYITGGSIRDILLGRVPADYDIAVTGNPKEFAEKMAASSSGHMVEIGKLGQSIIRVLSGNKIFDITSLSGTSIEDDLTKRDFTINAMAYDVSSGKIIDNFGGRRDLANKKIRLVSKEIFIRDPIRLLRAFRMGACLDFEIESQTQTTIRNHAALIQQTAGERVRTELFKMLNMPKSHHFIAKMDAAGLLTAIFPEIDPLKGCMQNRHHLYDGFEHTMRAYYHLENILNDPSKLMPEMASELTSCMDDDTPALLKCSILLHDIGKPSVKTKDKNGEFHFYGHAKKSADMALVISQRLKFSNREKQFVDFIIRNHLKPLFFFVSHTNKSLTKRALTRFFIKYADNTPYLLLHAIGDIMAKNDQIDNNNEEFLSFILEILRNFFYIYKPKCKEPPLLNGDDLIREFGLVPSPLFKKILHLVEEAKLTNKAKSRADALELVRDFLEKQR